MDAFSEYVSGEEDSWFNRMLGPMVVAQPKIQGGMWFCSIHSHYKAIPKAEMAEHRLKNFIA